MKKLLFGLIALSSVSFAQAGLFDFQNAKISSGTKFNTNFELVGTFDANEKKEIKALHEIKGETVVYEFLKLDANLKYGYEKEIQPAKVEDKKSTDDSKSTDATQSPDDNKPTTDSSQDTASSPENEKPKNTPKAEEGATTVALSKPGEFKIDDASSLGLELNFKKYGAVSARVKKSHDFILGYRYEYKAPQFKANLSTNYSLGYKDRIESLIERNKKTTDEEKNKVVIKPVTNKLDFNLGIRYEPISSFALFAGSKIVVDIDKEIDFSENIELGLEVNKYVKSITKVSYNGVEKAKEESDQKPHAFSVNENLSYEFKKGSLSVRPEVDLNAKFALDKKINLDVTPKVSASYDIVRGLNLNSSLSSKVKFEKSKEDNSKLEYKGVSPVLNLGLTYTIN